MYTFDSRVRYSETDEDGKLNVIGVLNYLQDCSTFQSEDLGLGIEYLQKNNHAWWLASWRIIIDRYPLIGEEITIGTWPYAFKGIYGYRNFVIKDKRGNYLVRADSTWFFFDTLAGRPVKAAEEDIRGYGSCSEKKLELEMESGRIRLPEKYDEKQPILICKHHIDTNHHVNNAQYVEIAKEVLPENFGIGELHVDYRKAAFFGDTIIPRVSNIENGYIIALCDIQGEAYATLCLKEKRG